MERIHQNIRIKACFKISYSAIECWYVKIFEFPIIFICKGMFSFNPNYTWIVIISSTSITFSIEKRLLTWNLGIYMYIYMLHFCITTPQSQDAMMQSCFKKSLASCDVRCVEKVAPLLFTYILKYFAFFALTLST